MFSMDSDDIIFYFPIDIDCYKTNFICVWKRRILFILRLNIFLFWLIDCLVVILFFMVEPQWIKFCIQSHNSFINCSIRTVIVSCNWLIHCCVNWLIEGCIKSNTLLLLFWDPILIDGLLHKKQQLIDRLLYKNPQVIDCCIRSHNW